MHRAVQGTEPWSSQWHQERLGSSRFPKLRLPGYRGNGLKPDFANTGSALLPTLVSMALRGSEQDVRCRLLPGPRMFLQIRHPGYQLEAPPRRPRPSRHPRHSRWSLRSRTYSAQASRIALELWTIVGAASRPDAMLHWRGSVLDRRRVAQIPFRPLQP
jgi:hypothetical protein